MTRPLNDERYELHDVDGSVIATGPDLASMAVAAEAQWDDAFEVDAPPQVYLACDETGNRATFYPRPC